MLFHLDELVEARVRKAVRHKQLVFGQVGKIDAVLARGQRMILAHNREETVGVNQSRPVIAGNARIDVHGEGDVDGARSLSKSTNSPLARMVDKGLSRLGRPLSDIQAAIENEGKLEVARLEKRVSLVATVASLGPMIGFLGTVTGMVTCFQDMAFAGNNIDISVLATGMYEAMVTTIGGLIVGIICYFLYNVLVTRINKVVLDIEVRATEFMDLLHEPA